MRYNVKSFDTLWLLLGSRGHGHSMIWIRLDVSYSLVIEGLAAACMINDRGGIDRLWVEILNFCGKPEKAYGAQVGTCTILTTMNLLRDFSCGT